MPNIHIAPCQAELHSETILEIFNHAILHTTALYDLVERDSDFMRNWFTQKIAQQQPVIGAFNDQGRLLGFTTYGAFRPQGAFFCSAEHSIYVHPELQGQGIGRRLLGAIIEHAQNKQLHALIGVIDANNSASIRLHQAFGFQLCGHLPQIGQKFGQWLHVDLYQKILNSAEAIAV